MPQDSPSSYEPRLHAFNYLQCTSTLRRTITSPMHYFLYVHRGNGQFIIDGTEYTCREGDLFYCPAGVQNTIVAAPRDPFLLSGVDFVCPAFAQEDGTPVPYKEHINIGGHPQFLWLTMELAGRMSVIDSRYTEYTNALFKAWLLLVTNLNTLRPEPSLAENVAQYLAAHLADPLTLCRLSERFKYHPNHINRVFRQRYGCPAIAYHEELRVKKALHLLCYSDCSVKEIASLCGFHDGSYFSRLFRKKTGYSPTHYRNHQIESTGEMMPQNSCVDE